MTVFPLYVEDLGIWVRVDPDWPYPGSLEFDDGGHPFIVLREYDERVLLHECLHVIFHTETEALEKLEGDDERIVRHLTRKLFAMGWRLHKTDRDLSQIEREINQTAFQRDELARQLDGSEASARVFDYPIERGEEPA